MKKVTGIVILATISAIFGIDALLDFMGIPTISEAVHNLLLNPINMVIYLTGVILLTAHFIGFKKEDK